MENKWRIFLYSIIFLIFIKVVALHHLYSTQLPDRLSEDYHPLIPQYGDLMFTFIILYLFFFLQTFLLNTNTLIPFGSFLIMGGFIWGVFCYYNGLANWASNFMNIAAKDLVFIYAPIAIYHISFCVDVPVFLKTFPQILVMGIPVFLLTVLTFGPMAAFIINHPKVTTKIGLYIGIFTSPMDPKSITSILNKESTRTKQISTLLEGESLIVFFLSELTDELIRAKINGFIAHWYQFAMVVINIGISGCLLGLFFGYIGRFLIRKTYTNRLSVCTIALGMPFFVYALSDSYVTECGSISILVTGVMMAQEKSSLPKEVEKFLGDIWELLGYTMDVIVCVKCSMMASNYITRHVQWKHYLLLFLLYLVNYLLRFIYVVLFSPIIRRYGYGMDLKSMVICAWGAVKGPFGLLIITAVYESGLHRETLTIFFFYCIGIYFLSVFINGTFTTLLLDFLGFRQISMARQVNMSNCMKHIFSKRERTITVLKMDRFLADVNWPIVIEITNMKHPYHMGMDNEEDENLYLGYRFTWCGDCKKDLIQEPTPREMREITREAKMRVLKSRKMSYSRQYENGMMSKEGIQVLSQTVELAMDSEDCEIKIEEMHKRFLKENCCKRFIRKRSANLQARKQRILRPPRTYWRRICYNIIVRKRIFAKIMLCVVLAHTVLTCTDLYFHPLLFGRASPNHSRSVDVALFVGHLFFTLCYITEFIMKILAFSWIHIFRDGFRTYFKSWWNVTEFVFMIACILTLTSSLRTVVAFEKFHSKEQSPFWGTLYQIIDFLILLLLLRIIRAVELFYPQIIEYLDKRMDTNMTFTFELGKCYSLGESEILEMLPYIIDNKKVRQELKQKIEHDRIVLFYLLGEVQKQKSWIAITVKTTQAIRIILNSMKEAICQLKSAGWADDYEFEKLMQSLHELYRNVNSIRKVQPSAPKVIFKEVAWMADDEALVEFLFENVASKSYEDGEVVFNEGDVADGIYIVVTGLFMLSYKPKDTVLESLKEYGLLPIVDYVSGVKYEEVYEDYVVSGNCIGALSVLTKRPYNCTITADGHSEVYVLSNFVLKKAMEMNSDPVMGLESKIWKEVTIRIAASVLISVPAYHNVTQDQIKYALERAFVPDLSKFKIFAVSDMIEDIIIIEGVAVDFNTREMFVAPCYIPRTIQKLILPSSSLLNMSINLITKLLIIPTKDMDEYDVMVVAEETGELNETASLLATCLQHTIQDRKVRNRRRRLRRDYSREGGPQVDNITSLVTSSSSVTAGAGLFATDVSSAAMFKSSQSEGLTTITMPGEEEEKKNYDYTDHPPIPMKRRQSLFFT